MELRDQDHCMLYGLMAGDWQQIVCTLLQRILRTWEAKKGKHLFELLGGHEEQWDKWVRWRYGERIVSGYSERT